jgi:hypothetical protein
VKANEDSDSRRRLVLKELDNLVRVDSGDGRAGLRDTDLATCDHLARRAHVLSKRLSFQEWQQAKTLRGLLTAVVQKARDTAKGPYSEVLAAAEFIGLRDESRPDPETPPSEPKLKGKPAAMRIWRGASYLPPRRGRPVKTYRNANPRVDDALAKFLSAIDTLLMSREDMDKFVASIVRLRRTSANPKQATAHSLSSDAAILTFGTTYIPRTELQAEFQRLIASQTGVVCLTGDRGYGKSRLARELVLEIHQTTGRDHIWLDASDQESLYKDLRNKFGVRGSDVTGMPRGSARSYLENELVGHLADEARGHPVVVLDNVRSWESIKQLIPTEPSTLYLVTSNDGTILPKGRGEDIIVGPMEDAQALEFARNLLPGTSVDDEQLRPLAVTALNGRPLAIEHACGFIERGQATIATFLAQLNTNAQVAFSSGDRPLASVYELTLNELAERGDRLRFKYRAAWVVLRIAAYLDHNHMPLALLSVAHSRLWSELEESNDVLPDFAFGEALDELQRRHLVTLSDNSLSMHSLTRDIFRDLLRPQAKEIIVAIQQAFLQNSEKALPFGPLPFDLVRQVHPVKTALLRLPHVAPGERRSLRLGHSVALVCRGLGDEGDVYCCSELLSRITATAPADWWDHLDDLEFGAAAARTGYNTRGVRQSSPDESIDYADAIANTSSFIYNLADKTDSYHHCLATSLGLDAYLAGFRHDKVLEQLQDVDPQLVVDSSAHESTHAWRGELLLRLGEARERLAQWDAAADTFERSCALFAVAGEDFTYGQLEALVRLVWCRMKDSKASSANPMTRLRDLYQSHGAQKLSRLLAAKIAHAWGASSINLFIRHQSTGTASDQLAEFGVKALQEAHELYTTIWQRRGVLAVEYELLRLKIVQQGDFRQILEQLIANRSETMTIDDPELAVQYELLINKALVLWGEKTPPSVVDRCMDIAYRAGSLFLPYWYNQAALTAQVAATTNEPLVADQRLALVVRKIAEDYGDNPGGIHRLVLAGNASLVGILSY